MMLLIVGRSGTGKDALARELAKYGLTQLKSHTTRAKRSEDEDTHVFITEEDAAAIPVKIAKTERNGHEYFATPEQVAKSDVYIVDPNGVFDMAEQCPNEVFRVAYIRADRLERRIHAVNRAEKPIQEEKIFEQREEDENSTFKEFEDIIQDGVSALPPNVTALYNIENDYEPATMADAAEFLINEKRLHENMLKVIDILIKHDFIEADAENPDMLKDVIERDGNTVSVTKKHYAEVLLSSQDAFDSVMRQYLRIVEL